MGAIRIVVPYLGGGFGAKTYAKLEPIAVVLARAARRPVLVETTVDEGFRTVRRCNAVCRVRIGANRDGRLVALATEIHYDVGAYADITPRVVQKGSYTAAGPYRIPHAHIQAYAVYTNTTPGGAFRGFGVPQISWAVESQLSEVAHHLGIDPIQLRMQNLLSKGDEYAAGDLPIDGDYRAGLGKLVEAMGTPAPQGEARGRGIACVIKASIAPSLSQALVRLHVDGSLTVLTSTVEMGQGARTALAQIAAEALGVPMESVRVALPDTAVTPYDQTTSSSRSTTIMGRVVQDAIRDLRRQLLPIAARLLQEPEEDLRLESGRVVGRTGSSVGLGAIVEAHFGMRGGELIGSGTMRAGFAPDAPLGGATPFWEVGMGAADVGVDRETGVLSVHRYVSLADVGCAINPQQTEAQEEGAVMQGLGHTLFERMVYEGGQLLNGSLVDYRVPRFTDVPCELHSILIENADGAGPFGAKGVGESGLLPVAPAVADALWAATGVRMRELPLEPEAVWRALRAHAEGAATPSRNAPVAARPPVVA